MYKKELFIFLQHFNKLYSNKIHIDCYVLEFFIWVFYSLTGPKILYA
jgi:hypothetical protein